MALVPAIEFGNLLAQLTAEETQRFIADLTQSHPKVILQLLSSRFIHQSNIGITDPLNSHCIDSISSIILSRDPDKHSTDSNVVKLNTLPLRLIGLCSSYLDQKSNRRLCLCDRSTYLGASSPNMLQELEELPTLDLSLFVSQIAKMPRLQSLNLLHLSANAVNSIATEKTVNRRIQSLRLKYHSISSLSAFSNLRFLYLDIGDEHATATGLEMKAMAQTLRNLVGLTLIDCPSPFGGKLLGAIGHQLEYLAVDYMYDTDQYMCNIGKSDYRNLKQFRMLPCCSVDIVNQILNTAVNLEKADIQLDDNNEDLDEAFPLIDKMLRKYEKLEYLEIRHDVFIEKVLTAIIRGLIRGREYEKKELKIKLYDPHCNVDGILQNVENEKDVIKKCVSIINQLACFKVEQWMLLLGGTNMIQRLKESVDSAAGCALRISEDQESNLTVITNCECNINGYCARWLM